MDLLTLYTEYVKPMKGSDRFHRWSFITCISGLLERRVWVDRGRLGVIFPNMYTILVGPPATGKSTAAQLPVGFLGSISQVDNKQPKIGPTKITQAALYQELKEAERSYDQKTKQSPLFIYASELAINMSDFGGGTLTNELIDFYDSKGHNVVINKRTMSGGIIKLHNPSVTILGCTTDSFLQGAAQDKLITSGLASRIVFCVEPNRVPKQRKTIALDPMAHRAILTGFERIYRLKGEFTFGEGAGDQLITLAEAADEACYESQGELQQNYFGRKPDHIIKIAMCIAASHGRTVIQQRDIQVATQWLTELEPDMTKAFGTRSIVKDTDLSSQIMRTVPWEPRWITRGDLINKLYDNGKFLPLGNDLEETMESLVCSRRLKVQQVANEELYTKPKERYETKPQGNPPTPEILSPSVGQPGEHA
jgi:hypothetical protein